MIICDYINVQDARIMNGLIPTISLMSKIESSGNEAVVIDFSRTKFISPVFALSLLVYASRYDKHITFTNMTEYMRAFRMDNVIMPDQGRKSEFIAIMESYAKRTYVPVISFPAERNNDDKEEILTVVENLIIRQSNIMANVARGLKYIISETIDNITEHSDSDRGYICAQAYPTKGYLDICIADRGVTLLGSYRKLDDNEIESDIEAI